jgi:amidase
MHDQRLRQATVGSETRRHFLKKGVHTGVVLSGLLQSQASANQNQGGETSLTAKSVTELAQLIRGKKVSSKEVVQAHLDRIEEVNPAINAVVQLARDQALADADRADKLLAESSTVGPLHGVPMTIKDSFDTAGIISTAGTPGRKDFIPKKDATVVARLKKAGAILLGKTNTPEMTFSFHTENKVYGRTKNPYDVNRSPGGSSGGAAAIIAAAGSPFDIGSDTAGSIRLPAHWCGITGLKPTSGRVPRTGHIIDHTVGVLESLTTVGPLARQVNDLQLIFPIIAGGDGIDPAIAPVALRDPALVEVDSLRIAFYSENGAGHPTRETKETIEQAAKELEKLGARVTNRCPDPSSQTPDIQTRIMFGDGLAWHHRGLFEAGSLTEQELMKRVSHNKSVVEFSRALADWNRFRGQMLQFMQDFDAIICPVQASPAPPFSNAWKGGPGYSYTQTYSLTGWPSAVIRCGTSSDGMPIGVQVVSAPWREDISLAVAKRLEQIFGGWQPTSI